MQNKYNHNDIKCLTRNLTNELNKNLLNYSKESSQILTKSIS